MTADIVLWGFGVLLIALSGLLAMVWKMLGQDIRAVERRSEQGIQELKLAWRTDLSEIKDNTGKMVESLDARHTRELDAISERLGLQIEKSERNIMEQIKLMVDQMRVQRG